CSSDLRRSPRRAGASVKTSAGNWAAMRSNAMRTTGSSTAGGRACSTLFTEAHAAAAFGAFATGDATTGGADTNVGAGVGTEGGGGSGGAAATAGSLSGSSCFGRARSNAAGPAPWPAFQVTDDGRSTASQFGEPSGAGAERGPAADRSPRGTRRRDVVRGPRQTRSTSGAATRWISGAGAKPPNARATAPSIDRGCVRARETDVARPSTALTPPAASAQVSR